MHCSSDVKEGDESSHGWVWVIFITFCSGLKSPAFVILGRKLWVRFLKRSHSSFGHLVKVALILTYDPIIHQKIKHCLFHNFLWHFAKVSIQLSSFGFDKIRLHKIVSWKGNSFQIKKSDVVCIRLHHLWVKTLNNLLFPQIQPQIIWINLYLFFCSNIFV